MWETSEIITRQSNRSLEDWSFCYNTINIGLNVESVGLFVGMKWRIKQLGTSRVNKSEPQLDSTEVKENYFFFFFFFLSGTLKQRRYSLAKMSLLMYSLVPADWKAASFSIGKNYPGFLGLRLLKMFSSS